MATKLFGDVKAGATSVSRPALLLKTADGTPDAGKVAADLTAYYYRQGAGATAPVTLADLANLNTAFTPGGVKEIADGAYRVDWPDLAFAAGADFVLLTVKDGATSAYTEAVAIEAHGADDVFGGMSTYAGGAVASVTAPVTVGANNDKAGYSLNLGQTGLAPRALDSVADGALTVGDGLVAAICAAAGKETVVGTAYTVKTPSTGTVVRTFALDSASTPTTRS